MHKYIAAHEQEMCCTTSASTSNITTSSDVAAHEQEMCCTTSASDITTSSDRYSIPIATDPEKTTDPDVDFSYACTAELATHSHSFEFTATPTHTHTSTADYKNPSFATTDLNFNSESFGWGS